MEHTTERKRLRAERERAMGTAEEEIHHAWAILSNMDYLSTADDTKIAQEWCRAMQSLGRARHWIGLADQAMTAIHRLQIEAWEELAEVEIVAEHTIEGDTEGVIVVQQLGTTDEADAAIRRAVLADYEAERDPYAARRFDPESGQWVKVAV